MNLNGMNYDLTDKLVNIVLMNDRDYSGKVKTIGDDYICICTGDMDVFVALNYIGAIIVVL